MEGTSRNIDTTELITYSNNLVQILRGDKEINFLKQCLQQFKTLQSQCDQDFDHVQKSIRGPVFLIYFWGGIQFGEDRYFQFRQWTAIQARRWNWILNLGGIGEGRRRGRRIAEDVEKLREMEISGEMRLTNSTIEIVMAKLNEIESLANAFDGCHGVFHTAGSIDPAGLSGYSKAMAEIEVNASKNVVKACGVTPSVRHCVLTSSLLTCVWRDNSCNGLPSLIDHSCWSDESVCQNKKLWYALGKLRAEKSAWEVAKESGVKLATICPGLITGPDFYRRSPTSTIAYLKGVQEMYVNGLLAMVDVNRLAEAHVCVFEGMKKTASGRYICFDRIIESGDEIENLARETGINSSTIIRGASSSNRARFELSNQKLFRLMSRTRRCFNE